MTSAIQREAAALDDMRKSYKYWASVYGILDRELEARPHRMDSETVGAVVSVGLRGDALISKARAGDRDAQRALAGLISVRMERGEQFPPNLRSYSKDVMLGRVDDKPKRSGPQKSKRFRRNFLAATMVEGLRLYYGFNPTRFGEKGAESACSIVATVLCENGEKLGEEAVRKIWENFRDNEVTGAMLEAAVKRQRDAPQPLNEGIQRNLETALGEQTQRGPSEKSS